MSTRRWALKQPAHFDFIAPDGTPCRGADQEWYRDPWQRKAGCGPTTAATCLSYLARQAQALEALRPPESPHAPDFVPYMEEVWQWVTPTEMGLNRLDLFWEGALALAHRAGCELHYEALDIPAQAEERPGLEALASFLRNALEADRPVAFLNFSNGALENLESWHWVPLIWAEARGEGLLAGVLDEGVEKTIDLALWLETSRRGGGLVVLGPANE